MNSYFGPTGNKYNLGRVPIGGSDFSSRPYTYADEKGDETLKNFKLSEEDEKYKVSIIILGPSMHGPVD